MARSTTKLGVLAQTALPIVSLAILSAAPGNAATLVGSATLNVLGDLTVIDDGGTLLEFLDLPVTANMTPGDAVAAYAGDGFSFGTDDEVTALLDAFGTTYAFAPFTFVDLGADPTDRADFINFLGVTGTNNSLGWLDTSGAGGNPDTYLCMSVSGACGPASFVNNDLTPPESIIGVFLVRVVPEPSTLLLLATGVAATTAARRRRQSGR